MEPGRTLIKHSAAIHMTNVLSALERRVYNALLYVARPTMGRGVDHTIETRGLLALTGCTPNNRDHLIDTAIGLVGRTVTYNLFGKDARDGDAWRMTSVLLAEGGFNSDRSQLRYSFPNSIVELLKSPSLYARVNLSVQRKMRRSGSMALYEFYLDMLGGRRSEVEFSIDVADLRRLLGATDKLDAFKALRSKAIEPAHQEINAVSDLRVSIPRMLRVDHSIKTLVIHVERAEGAGGQQGPDEHLPPDSSPVAQFGADPEAPSLKDPAGSKEDAIRQRLVAALGADVATRALSQYGLERVQANFDYACDMYGRGGIRSLPAYFVRALQDDYAAAAARPVPQAPRPQARTPSPEFSAADDPIRAREDLRTRQIRAWYSALDADEQARWREAFEASDCFRLTSTLRKRDASSPLYMGALLMFLSGAGIEAAS